MIFKHKRKYLHAQDNPQPSLSLGPHKSAIDRQGFTQGVVATGQKGVYVASPSLVHLQPYQKPYLSSSC